MYAYVFIFPFSQLFLYSSFRQHAFILKSISADFSLTLTLKTLYMYFNSVNPLTVSSGRYYYYSHFRENYTQGPRASKQFYRGETYRWPVKKKIPQASRSKQFHLVFLLGYGFTRSHSKVQVNPDQPEISSRKTPACH